MIEITLNGESRQLEEDLTVQRLIEQQNLTGKRIAVEINLDILPRSEFDNRCLQHGDRVEIVHAIGGG